jgi:hypothetical protein
MTWAASVSCWTPRAKTDPEFRIGRRVTEIDARRQLMKRFLVGLMVAAVAAIGFGGMGAFASQGMVHFGPFDSSSPDSGTCGNNWANDTYKRVFDASTTANPGGSFTVTERFIAGRFVTMAGSSPGACDPNGVTGGTIGDGVTGAFKGNEVVVVTGGTFNPAAICDVKTCGTTADFVATVYGADATLNVTSFGFTYHANGPGLLAREWQNASSDQGGNLGDIASA